MVLVVKLKDPAGASGSWHRGWWTLCLEKVFLVWVSSCCFPWFLVWVSGEDMVCLTWGIHRVSRNRRSHISQVSGQLKNSVTSHTRHDALCVLFFQLGVGMCPYVSIDIICVFHNFTKGPCRCSRFLEHQHRIDCENYICAEYTWKIDMNAHGSCLQITHWDVFVGCPLWSSKCGLFIYSMQRHTGRA